MDGLAATRSRKCKPRLVETPARRILAEGPIISDDSSVKTGKRIPELDGLRDVAIALVLVWHYFVFQAGSSDFLIMDQLLKPPLTVTWSGVDLFFVLSGFLIGGILIDYRTLRVGSVRRFGNSFATRGQASQTGQFAITLRKPRTYHATQDNAARLFFRRKKSAEPDG